MTKKNQLIFLGPPGCGKGTQTEKLSRELNLPHIDTGSLLRAEIAADSEYGKIAKSFIDKGQLVPPELAADVILQKIMSKDCENGYILDGFPRSIMQADIFEKVLAEKNINDLSKRAVIKMMINRDFLMERLVNRRLCKGCTAIYNLKTKPPKNEGICDACGGELYQRSDDKEEVALTRFETYNNETAPLVTYYEQKGLLHFVDSNADVETVHKRILESIS